MTAPEILAKAARLGLHLRVEGENVLVSPARALPETLAEEIRVHKAEVMAALVWPPRARPCLGCAEPAPEGVLLCPACWTARQARGTVVAFDPTRAHRARRVLGGKPCPKCRATEWRISSRGDAHCEGCARAARATRRPSGSGSPRHPYATLSRVLGATQGQGRSSRR